MGVATWRRKALALFPELRFEVQRPRSTIYGLFFRLLPMVRLAHAEEDDERLRQIYGFAEWCFEQNAKELWNAAGVAFYEHLFDSHPSLWHEVVEWLSPSVVEGCWGLWEFRLSSQDLAEVRRLLAECRQPLYETSR